MEPAAPIPGRRSLLNTPKAQGIAGFFEQEQVSLPDVKIKTGGQYLCIQLVSLDGKELSASERILLQAGTTYRLTGWQEEPAGFEQRGESKQGYKILNTGGMPWKGRQVDAEISLANDRVREAILLDTRGYFRQGVAVRREQGTIHLKVPPNTTYLILQR